MKIENIIDDIKNDITDLSHKLEEEFRKENPLVIFSVSLPGIEELATIKTIALTIKEENTTILSVHVHTHNGNRVFENACQVIGDNQMLLCNDRHPLQDKFVGLLRDIIKRKKHKKRAASKVYNAYADQQPAASTV